MDWGGGGVVPGGTLLNQTQFSSNREVLRASDGSPSVSEPLHHDAFMFQENWRAKIRVFCLFFLP